MKNFLKGTVLFAQSGGPTSVINASAAGVFKEALKYNFIENIIAARYGIKGILEEDFIDIKAETKDELNYLITTPGSYIGSVRKKLKDYDEDPSDYIKLLNIFRKYNIRYFLYNGGNDSMDTCNKISKFFKSKDYECYCIGVPKTIDNDLCITDHTPGFGSCAKYIATSLTEMYQDFKSYDNSLIYIVEVMGRNAGWLAASAVLGKLTNSAPDYIYLPEVEFDVEKFIANTKKTLNEKNKVFIVVSEGIKDKNNRYISDYLNLNTKKDEFGHKELGSTSLALKHILEKEVSSKIRAIELSVLQRSAGHLVSAVDLNEAYNAGRFALISAINKNNDCMVGFRRINKSNENYKIKYDLIKLEDVANNEKLLSTEFIDFENNYVNDNYIDYVLPLIQGTIKAPLKNELPRFAHLKMKPFKLK